MKNHVTAEQNARDMLERMGVPDAQEYSAGELVELANLIVSADTPVALAEAYRCGKEAGDAEIAELRQQLATIADKVREECASAAWLHYMDVCKKHGHGPNVERIRDFCSTEAIRAMKEPKL